MPEYFVNRPRLERLLDDVGTRPLTLVIAPAGSGKTQLLANWVDHGEMPTAWLSLEGMDDNAVELWTAVIAALQALVPDVGRTAAAQLTHEVPLTEVVGALLDDLDADDRTASVLVIDDIHHLRGSAVMQSLVLFLGHLPAWLHVVVAGRGDPDWPLHRMRVRGQLVEVRFADLRLTHGEARKMLSRLVPELSDDEIESSVILTEGWAAGVQLAALAARRGPLDEVARPWRHDTHLLTADYVWHEVLAAGDADIVDVLMRLSVVDRFDTALGTSITGHPDVHQVLLRGEAQGLFVHRLRDDWFRIHPLVREAMLDELRRRGAHRELHARAARFLEDAGETVTALEQWLLAERHRDALRLLSARSTQLYDQGREELMARTLEAIPREVGYSDVPAMIDFAVSNMLFSSVAAFVDTVREVTWHAARSGVDYSPHIDALQAVSSAMSGDWTAGGMYAKRSLAALGDDWWRDPAGRFAWNTVARGIALSEQWADEDEVVRDATFAVRRDPRRGIALEGIRATGHALAGRPVDALRVAAGVHHAAPTMTILRVELALAEAVARLELGDRERAIKELGALADVPDEPRMFAPVAAMLHLALAAVDDGDPVGALVELDRAVALVESVSAGQDLCEWVHRAGVVVAVANGNVEEARRHAEASIDSFWAPASRARVDLALGDALAASVHLDVARPRCPRHHVVLGLLRARAASTSDEVVAQVGPAVALASAHGMLQTVVGDGRELMDAIERVAWQVPDEWLCRLRSAMAPSGLGQRVPTRDLPEVLTDREREVLCLLPSRLTLGEIAGELYVSPNTVKFHLRIIYRKLGVNSRAAAADVARSMTRSAAR